MPMKALLASPSTIFKRSVCHALTNLPVEIVQADSGAGAMRILLEERFDMILIDAEMGDFSGLLVVERARERDPEQLIPVLYFSSANSYSDVEQALSEGVDDYILIPFANSLIYSKVQSHIERLERKRAALVAKALPDPVKEEEVAEAPKPEPPPPPPPLPPPVRKPEPEVFSVPTARRYTRRPVVGD
jgi:PleD family two-component response regulator